jgi:hypothetical protein
LKKHGEPISGQPHDKAVVAAVSAAGYLQEITVIFGRWTLQYVRESELFGRAA